MPDILLSQPMYMLVSLVLSVVVTGAMIGGTVLFEQQRSRLDPATRWHDIRERLAIKREELARKEAEIADAARKLSERDRVVAETAALEERRDAVRLELGALDDAKRQIEQTKQEAADAATELAVRQDAVAAARKELATSESELADAKAELERVSKEVEKESQKFCQIPADLKDTIDELRSSLAEIKAEKGTLEEELLSLRSERGLLVAQRAEHAEIAARKEALTHHVEDLTAETKKKLEEAGAIAAQISGKAIELAHLQQTMSGANQELQSVREEVQALVARKEILERELEKQGVSDTNGSGEPEEMIADLKKLPTLLAKVSSVSRGPQNEADALEDVNRYLRNLKLSYDRRIVTAFHTALKINDTSQLTVLAGVSVQARASPEPLCGSDGNALSADCRGAKLGQPTRFAGFLQLYREALPRDRPRSIARPTRPVQHVEFRGRSISRSDDAGPFGRDEFGARGILLLGVPQPSRNAAVTCRSRVRSAGGRDFWISIDIRGIKKGSINLFPPHNMLFAGTMNDDESTQSLSDKVLDRSNIMQFAAPEEFTKQQQVAAVPRNKDIVRSGNGAGG